MMYHYMTVNSLGGLEVCHSEVRKDGTVIVHFELPDKDIGFKEADILLPTYTVCNNLGFTKNELSTLGELCRDNAHLLIQYAKTGGIENA